MNKYFKDISGQRFGTLIATDEYEQRTSPNGNKYYFWKCICDCGRERWVRGTQLRYGTTRGCGHHHQTNLKHGMVNSRLYTIYNDMKQRCYNPKNKAYKYYGGRGISICDDWLGENGFIKFSNWSFMNGYTDELTIDRINVNGNYEPGNCRWTDDYTQMKNRRNSIYISDGGKEKYLLEASKDHTIQYKTLECRLKNGWSEDDLYDDTPKARKVTYQGQEYTLKELAEVTGISYNTLQTRYSKNFTDEEIVKEPLATLKKAVFQYSLDGQFIAEYESATEASRITGIRKSGIIMCCNHQRNKCGGYRWEHKTESIPKREERCLRRKENGGWIDNRGM